MRKTLLAGLGILLIILGSYALGVSFDEFLNHFKQIRMDYILLVTVMAFATMYFNAYRWAIVVRASLPEAFFPKGFFLLTYLVASFSSLLMPNITGSMGIKTLTVKTTGKTTWETALLICIMDQGINFAMAGLMILPCLILFLKLQPQNILLILSYILITGFLVILLYYKYVIMEYLDKFIIKISTALSRLSSRMAKMLEKKAAWDFIRSFIENREINRIVIYSILSYFFPIIRYYYIAVAMDIHLPFMVFIISFPIIYFIISFSPTPSGLGFQEMGWVAVMMYHGIDHNLAMAFALTFRIVEKSTLILMVALGYLYLLATGVSLASFSSQFKSPAIDNHNLNN
ncbi:MAG: flippase-like domain-containing protein [Magnetococcus sp. YQC-5]